MTRSLEKDDEALKARSRTWWSLHSQDYVEPGETPHQGVCSNLSDEAFLGYLNDIDRSFRAEAYFAQHRKEPLFSGLMPLKWLKGKRALEVGCGLGAHTEMLCRAGALVTAVDLSPTSVEVTRRRLRLKGLKGEVLEGDAESLPFPNETFDYIWSWGVIHHSPNTIACAREIVRVLRPSGQFGIMLYHRNSMYNWINVIFRYGILHGKLRNMSVQELHNRYTDGKEQSGAPLSKYYSRQEIREELFPQLTITRQRCFEQKHAFTFLVPARWRRAVQKMIPDSPYTWLWSRLGFLIFSEGFKPGG